MFKVMSTADLQQSGPTKVLLYAHHGWGKTYQCRHYQKRYGKGLILSGEAGLKSVEDVGIDHLPFFMGWKARSRQRTYSFRGIVKMMMSDDFQAMGYKWIALDSLQNFLNVYLSNLRTSKRVQTTLGLFVEIILATS